jgi:uncharacterized protein YxjI
MSQSYLMSRKWSLTDRFAITDEAGITQFEVQGRMSLTARLSIRDASGTEIAAIRKAPFSRRHEIDADGQHATVTSRGFFGRQYEIESAAGHLEARGNFSGRQYVVTRDGSPAATVAQRPGLRERFAIEVADGESSVLMLAVILVIETIRDQRRRAAAAS